MMLSAFYYLSIHVLFLLLIHAHIVFKSACQRNRRFKYQSHKLYTGLLRYVMLVQTKLIYYRVRSCVHVHLCSKHYYMFL